MRRTPWAWPCGWVPVDDLLTACAKAGFVITYDDLVDCVETNDKQRFSFDDNGVWLADSVPADYVTKL